LEAQAFEEDGGIGVEEWGGGEVGDGEVLYVGE